MRRTLAGAVLVLVLLAPPAAAAATAGRYDAEIRRTQGGVPHVKARDLGSLGFGYAYAYAEDQACRFADIIATVNAQRSRYFGPDGGYQPYTGSSFVMAAALTGKGPRGHAVLRYSQSENPSSSRYADQTRLYAQERWLPLRFTERAIRDDPDYTRLRVTGRR